jgi:hypothetical protein
MQLRAGFSLLFVAVIKRKMLKGTHARDFIVRFSQFFGIIQ